MCTSARSFLDAHPQGETPPGFVLAGDFNSVPHLQPAFLPASLAARLPNPVPPPWSQSATYKLLASGEVESDHPEHPDNFMEHSEYFTCTDPDADVPASKRKMLTKRMGSLSSKLCLRDGYFGSLTDGPLPLSTHAGDFAGCIDYIWLSDSSASVQVAAATPTESAVVRDCTSTSNVHVHKVLEMPYSLTTPETFEMIPSAQWPSDHLAIGVQISVS